MGRYERVKDYEPLFDEWYVDGVVEEGQTQSVYLLKHGYHDSCAYVRVVRFYDEDIRFLENTVERVLSFIDIDGGKYFGCDVEETEQYIIEEDGVAKGIEVCMLMKEYNAGNDDITLIDGFALHAMGIHYMEQKDFEHAAECFREGMNHGSCECISALGGMYEDGFGVEQNYTKAAELYLEASELGSVLATCDLGNLYEEGLGVEKDGDRAFELYQLACDGGLTKAIWKIGYCYEFGIGVEEDIYMAVEYYRKACFFGYDEAYYCLGTCVEFGEGTELDYQEAMKWYQEGIKLGDERCMFRAGGLYEYGLGVELDYAIATKYYEESAALGYMPAVSSLGNCYLLGNGVEEDGKKARELFLTAARAGYPRAQVFLAFYYEEHPEIRHALYRAKYWYKQAIKNGEPQALCGLGYLYEVEWRQPEKAFEYYMEAAIIDYPPGICNVAFCYETGEGVEANQELAIQYYQKAAALGFPRAMCNLANIFVEVNTPESLELAFELNFEAARRGYPTGEYNVGVAYQFGIHVEVDMEKAKEYYIKASEKGNNNAIYNLACVYAEEDREEEALHLLTGLYEMDFVEAGYRIYFILHDRGDDSCYEYLKGSAAKGYVPAIYELGDYYAHEDKRVEAFECFDTAARTGHPGALARLGWCYLVGFGTKTDKRKAVELLKVPDTGYSNYLLGCMYLYGDGRKQNNRLARKYLERAQEQEYAEAAEELMELFRREIDELQ